MEQRIDDDRSSRDRSLKGILQSSTIIPKVCFDLGKSSGALFAHVDIALDSIQDIQLIRYAAANGRSVQIQIGVCIVLRDVSIGMPRCLQQKSRLGSIGWTSSFQRDEAATRS